MSERVYKQIKRVALISTGTTPPTNIDDYYTSEDVDWYTPSDFSYETISTMPAEKKISNRFFSESAHNLYNSDSVAIVGIGATVGKVGFINHAFYANQQINILSFNREVLPKYAAYYLFTERDRITSTTPSVTLPILNQTRLGNLWINYPSLDVQQRIVSYLDAETAKIDHAIELLKKKREAYTRLKASVINRAVTRGLNPNVKLKDSGVEWIGMIPEGWEVKRIKNLCDYVTRGSTPNYVDYSLYKVMNQATFSKGYIDDERVRYSDKMESYSNIKKDDLLIASTGGGILGKLLYFENNENDFYADTHVTIMRSSDYTTSTKFLYYAFYTKYDMINATMVKGSTNQTELQRNYLLNYELPIPSLSEQHAIASYLDTRCARIDKAAAIVDKQIDAYTRLKKSLINEVVTGKRRV